MTTDTLARWHLFMKQPSPEQLDSLLADDAVFHSPVVHTPQQGKQLVSMYLNAAGAVFLNGPFEYIGEWRSDQGAVLEFRTELEGTIVNGVDIIRWNDEGLIVEFKVMLRPLRAVNTIHRLMQAMLDA